MLPSPENLIDSICFGVSMAINGLFCYQEPITNVRKWKDMWSVESQKGIVAILLRTRRASVGLIGYIELVFFGF